MTQHLLAQQLNIGPTTSVQTIQGPLVGINNLGDLTNRLNIFIMPIASVILFGVLIWGGYDFLMSGGSEEKIQAGKAKMTAGIIGFALLVFSYFIVKFIGVVFGLGGIL